MKKNNLSFVITMFFSVLTVPVFGANNIPKWQQEMNERAKELEQLQKQNGAGTEYIQYTDFPKTANDLSFSARQQLEKESIEPYKNLKAYQELDIKTAEEWCPDHLNDPGCEKYKAKAEEKKETPVDKKQDIQPKQSFCTTKLGKLDIGHAYIKRPLSDCDEIEKTESNTSVVKSWKIICRDGGKLVCKPYGCTDNYTVDDKPGKCVSQDTREEQCTLTPKTFNFSDTDTIFRYIQVKSPEVAQKIAQEYIKCSTNPSLKATENYTTKSNDDLLEIIDSTNSVVQKIRFDDVTESDPLVFIADTIRALCIIAHADTTRHSSSSYQNVKTSSATCSGLTESQFSEISSKIQDLISPTGETFNGRYCYELKYKTNSKYLNYFIHNNGCASKIVIEP